MYGLVNAAVQDFVVSNFGVDKWEKIKSKAGISMASFNRMEPYPDDVTYKLVGAASEVLGVGAADALKAFGEFWVLYTGKAGYGELFDSAGRNLREFLFNLDNLHTRVGASFPKLRPPSFRFEVIDDEMMRMHYHPGAPNRVGLCAMVDGLLIGLAKHFETELQMEQTACKEKGADHCEWLLKLSDKDA
jgi:predicted hydrocarbon binding protein